MEARVGNDVGIVKETVSKVAEELGKKVEENKSDMINVVSHLVDKLTGKDLAITYEFDNLQLTYRGRLTQTPKR